MAEPEISGAKPILVTLGQKGDAIFWCACGRSNSQPFCDGSHAGTPFRPLRYVVARNEEEGLFCACKRTRTPPFCDGSHNRLRNLHLPAANDEISASADIPVTVRDDTGLARLDGKAFVHTPNYTGAERQSGWRIFRVITRKLGADQLTQLILEAGEDATRPISFAGSEVVVFIARGRGRAMISERTLAIEPECAVVVRPGESVTMTSEGATSILATATVCPHQDAFEISAATPSNFDDRFPERVGRVDAAQRQAT
ncbi:MAG: CDGSH iron-sulfur domain-containing protein, partial [Parvularculaceae bacterium]